MSAPYDTHRVTAAPKPPAQNTPTHCRCGFELAYHTNTQPCPTPEEADWRHSEREQKWEYDYDRRGWNISASPGLESRITASR